MIHYDFHGNLSPVNTVSNLFDSYEEAKIIAEEKNKEMKNNLASKVYFSVSDPRFEQTLSAYENEFTEQLSICQLFEKLALLKTEDMTITESITQAQELQLIKKL